jgi:antitoxin (DNA-binding transcriptional repressor) of toxin-antitoxin stability system
MRKSESAREAIVNVAICSYFRCMRAVGIKVLKNRLSEYIRLVKAGETVLVTDHDTVVAELGPPRPERSTMIADVLLAEAVRNGWVAAPFVASGELPNSDPVASLSELLEELREDRDAR